MIRVPSSGYFSMHTPSGDYLPPPKIDMSQIDTSKLLIGNQHEVKATINQLFNIALRPPCDEQKNAQDVLFKTFSNVERKDASNYVTTKCKELYNKNHLAIDSSRKLRYIYGSTLGDKELIEQISMKLSNDSYIPNIWDNSRFINEDEIKGSINKIIKNFGIANNLSIGPPICLERLEQIVCERLTSKPKTAPPIRPPSIVAQIPPNKFSPPVRMTIDTLFPVSVDNHWILVVQSNGNQENNAIVFHSSDSSALTSKTQSRLAGLFNKIEYKHSKLQDSEHTINGCGLFLSKAIECVMTKDNGMSVKTALDEFIADFSQMGELQKLNFNISTRRSLYADFVDYFSPEHNQAFSYSSIGTTLS